MGTGVNNRTMGIGVNNRIMGIGVNNRTMGAINRTMGIDRME